MEKLGKIALIGGGSWATAIAKMVLSKEISINWYMHRQDRIDAFIEKGHNPAYLTNVAFETERINFTTDINECIKDANTLIFATPSPYLAEELKKLKEPIANKIIITAIKGIIPNKNLIISDYFAKIHQVDANKIAAVAGPCHAEEVAKNNLSYLTVACPDKIRAQSVAHLLACDTIKVTTNSDIVGVEYSAVLKNVYALAAGIYNGLNYGDNFQAVFLSNAIQEMAIFLNNIYPVNRNICESVYLGDLLVTGYSKYSRNRTFGFAIGKGYTIADAQEKMGMIAEGYFGTKCIHEINKKHAINMPILDAVYGILYENKDTQATMKQLTSRLK